MPYSSRFDSVASGKFVRAFASASVAHVASSDPSGQSVPPDSHGPRYFSSRSDASWTDVIFSPTTSMTNATFATALCEVLNASTNTLVIASLRGFFFTYPACARETATELTSISMGGIVITSWSSISPSVSYIDCTNCVLNPEPNDSSSPLSSPASSSTASGYDESGNLDWNDIWSLLPSLSRMYLVSSRLPALPSVFSSAITHFGVIDNGVGLGAIPSTLFSRYASLPPSTPVSLTLTLTGSGLNGTIPSDLLQPLKNRSMPTISLLLGSNELSGSLPPNLLSPLNTAKSTTFVLLLSGNKLSGAIPQGWIPEGMIDDELGISTFSLDLSRNSLSGPIPDLLFDPLSNLYSLTFYAGSNQLSGTLPSRLLNNSWADTSSLILDLSFNQIVGTIPDDFFSNSLTETSSNGLQNSNVISLANNHLTGTFPKSFYCSQRTGSCMLSRSTYLDVSNNDLSGTIPFSLVNSSTIAPGGSVTITLDSNGFTGHFPEWIANSLSGPSASLTISAKNNSFIGDAPITCNGLSSVSYDASLNLLNGTIPEGGIEDCPTLTLHISGNFGLKGIIPPALFNRSFLTLTAANTSLSGPIPTNLEISNGFIDLRSTAIDFCSAPWSHPNIPNLAPYMCLLDDTAAACDCPRQYPGCSLVCRSGGSNPPPSPPGETHGPLSCDLKTRPSAEFVCIGGVWTAPFVTTPILTIPSGAGTVVVDGNVTSTSIVINGTGSQIVIRGCAANLTMVTVTLTQEQLKQLGSSKTLQNLVTFSNASACDTNLNGLALDTQVSHGCRKVRTEKVISSDGNTFGAYFTVDASGCNTWWIVLVSVVCGVIILGIAVAIVSVVIWRHHQKKKEFGRLSTFGAKN